MGKCDKPLRAHLKQKQEQWRGKGQVMAADSAADPEPTAGSTSELSKEAVTSIVMETVSALQKGGKKAVNLLTMADSEPLWAAAGSTSSQPEGGFAYDDAYSSDGSGLGLLTAYPGSMGSRDPACQEGWQAAYSAAGCITAGAGVTAQTTGFGKRQTAAEDAGP